MEKTKEGVAKLGRLPREKYARIHEFMPIPCVDMVLIFRKGIVLVKREVAPAKWKWFFPGGAVQKGEYRREAVQRKAKP